MTTVPERPAPGAQRPPRSGLLPRLGDQHELILFLLLALLTVGAWALTISQAGTMGMPMGLSLEEAAPVDPALMDSMESMDGMAGPARPLAEPDADAMRGMSGSDWSIGGLILFVGLWAVMMTAMMLPTVTPMLLLYRTLASRQAPDVRVVASALALAAGYLLVWSVVGVGVYGLLRLANDAASRLESSQRLTVAPLALGAVLILAGLYQFTPLKHACLRQCQSPLGFLLGHWGAGSLGAVRMGLVHGLYCVGCCWAIFAVLVATGVMSLPWMLALTLVVFAEKVLPFGQRLTPIVGVGFIALGVLVASGAVGMLGVV